MRVTRWAPLAPSTQSVYFFGRDVVVTLFSTESRFVKGTGDRRQPGAYFRIVERLSKTRRIAPYPGSPL